MRDTFLKSVAADLVRTCGADLSGLTVVLPYSAPIANISKYLFDETNESLGKPAYTTMAGLLRRASGLETPDELRLLCSLYLAYRRVLQRKGAGEAMEFGEFCQWGEMILNDFNDTDKELADARLLFRDVSAVKRISAEDFLDENRKAALMEFFNSFMLSADSRLKEKYLAFWNILADIYDEFGETSLAEKTACEGAAFRKGLEAMEKRLRDGAGKYVFVGFNALCGAERELMLHCMRQGKALFYWDYDTAYCDGVNEAGLFMAGNLKTFGNKLGREHFGSFGRCGRVRIIESPTKSGSVYYARKWLRAIAPEERGNAVIVPADTGALPMLLHCLEGAPDCGFNAKRPVYATAAYACLMRRAEAAADKLAGKGSGNAVPEFLLEVKDGMERFADGFGTGMEPAGTVKSRRAALETKACEFILKAIGEIKELADSGLLATDARTAKSLLQRRVRGGLLEAEAGRGAAYGRTDIAALSDTRLFDYDNVLVLGCNEGSLPHSRRVPSFIPNHIRAIYGLPTVESRNAVSAYNFYRLLQRAGNAALLYVSAQPGLNSREPSRFVLQILGEDKIPFKAERITCPSDACRPAPPEVRKTPAMLARMLSLEATSLYQYIRCPLMFYYSKVAGVRPPDPDASKTPANLFGTLFHKAMQLFYESECGEGLITAETLRRALKDGGAELEPFIRKAFADSGVPENAVIRKVVREYMGKIIAYDMRNTPFLIRRHLTERFLYTDIQVRTKQGQTVTARVGGKFDRVDRITVDGREITRVVDYKTSRWKKQLEAKDMQSVFGRPKSDKHYDYIFQTFLYSLALLDRVRNQPGEAAAVAPAVFFMTASAKDSFDPYILYGGGKERLLDFSAVEGEFRECLLELLQEMFDIETPFREGYPDSCGFCSYRLLCGK